MAVQSPTNASLGRTIGSAAQASFFSFFSGAIILALIIVFSGSQSIIFITNVPFWQIIGGFYAFLIVFGMAFVLEKLGVTLAITTVMFGQLLSSIVVDTFGLFQTEVTPISLLRLIGIVFACIGLIFIYQGKKGADNHKTIDKTAFIYLVYIFIAGFLSGFQAPTNAALARAIGNTEATFISFVGGSLCTLVLIIIIQKGQFFSFKGTKAWQLLGGVYGVFGISIMVFATPILGVVILSTSQMLGQFAGGIVIDTLGLFDTSPARLNPKRIIGLLLFAVCIALNTMAKF